MTIPATCALSARPLPVTAAFTSVGVCQTTGMPASAAASTAAAEAWAVPITLCRLCWLNMRSTASTSGEVASTRSRTRLAIRRRRSGRGAEAGVTTTSTWRMVNGRPGAPSTRPNPHRVRPGSTPSTSTPPPGYEQVFAP